MTKNSQDFNLFLTVCKRRVLCHFEKALESVLVTFLLSSIVQMSGSYQKIIICTVFANPAG